MAQPAAFKRLLRHQQHQPPPAGAVAVLLAPAYYMFDLLVSARLFTLLALLFVAPAVWDVLTDRGPEATPGIFNLRCPTL